MKKFILVCAMILGLTSCSEEPLKENEIEKDLFIGTVVYKTTEINNNATELHQTFYVLLLKNNDIVVTDLPHWYYLEKGDSIKYIPIKNILDPNFPYKYIQEGVKNVR